MLHPAPYSRFDLYRLRPEDVASAPREPFPFCDGSTFRITTVIDQPATQIVYEDWFKGEDVEWTAFCDAIHFVTEGAAEITVWDPPAWEAPRVEVAEAPCVYLIPRGARVRWRVLSEEPFRKIVADVPNPGFTFPAPAGGQA